MPAVEDAVSLFGEVGLCYVATADAQGLPHLATASAVELVPGDAPVLRVRYWFCPRTVGNLRENPRVSVTIWEAAGDRGYQLLGRVERMEDHAYLNGFHPETDGQSDYPSVQRVLELRVEGVLEFRHAPHGDRVLDGALDQRSS